MEKFLLVTLSKNCEQFLLPVSRICAIWKCGDGSFIVTDENRRIASGYEVVESMREICMQLDNLR